LKVLYRLHKSGYQAFLVGGCVRDAMLVLHPKDFDVATDATPDEVRALFSNCRLIGRRFRLAHVRFGREIIEVATFRSAANHSDDDHAHDDEGRIVRDNVYGSIDEDVWRRDFTCNSLYYNIADFSIWDYTGGVEDIEKRHIALIGDPDKRLREDPVRMLRAVRFAAKLNFTIDETVVKVPATDEELNKDESFVEFVRAALRNTDRRVKSDHSVTPMFLIGVFLWSPTKKLAADLRSKEKISESQSLSVASYELSGQQQRRIAIPRRFTAPMREMLALQPRFTQMRGKKAMKLLEHRRFRAAYDFMMLLAEVGQFDSETAKFWTEVQEQSAEERATSFQINAQPSSKRRRRRRRRPKPANSS
jgi:poly(A) polymerase